jgi:hypothetical protein
MFIPGEKNMQTQPTEEGIRNKLVSLKEGFPFLAFFNDTEILDFLSMVLAVSFTTAVEPEEILRRMSDQFSPRIARC